MRAQFRGIGATFASASEVFRGKKVFPPNSGGPECMRIHGAQMFPSGIINREMRLNNRSLTKQTKYFFHER